ncbi:hypothetical protein JCM14469_16200 [Desulfatiferula olefinivorans]
MNAPSDPGLIPGETILYVGADVDDSAVPMKGQGMGGTGWAGQVFVVILIGGR